MKVKKAISRALGRHSYFLIIGAGRGGTSLLTTMIDFHPGIQVGFERFAIDFLLGEKIPQDKKKDLDIRLKLFDESCVDEASKNGDRLWGNKITTEQISALDECVVESNENVGLHFLQKVIKSQKLIYIVRDGRHCVQSKMKRTDQSYEEALARWKYSVALLRDFEESKANMHLCKYEDLLKDPEHELAKICSFLGKEYDDAMLKGPASPKMPGIYSGKTLRQVPPLNDEQKQWTADMKEELQYLGYLDEN